MFIKKNKNKKIFFRNLFIKRGKTIFIKICLLFIFLILYTFSYSIFITNNKSITRKLLSPTLIARIKDSTIFHYIDSGFQANIIKNFFVSKLIFEEGFYLNIKFKDLKKLEYKRSQALDKGVLISSENDYVKAMLVYKNKNYPINIRLKGDWVNDHLVGDKWSFRVKLRKGKTLFGMKKFSLQTPKTRNYIHEWIFHKLLKYEKLPGLKYEFVPLFINGKSMGIYAIEEHFDTILIESNEYKEGPILKLSESDLWQRAANNKDIKFERFEEWDEISFENTYPEVFQEKTITENPILRKNLEYANYLLESFLKNELNASEVFDIDSLAKFVALIDLAGAGHALKWHNLRFYYNPIIAKLIPVGFDANAGYIQSELPIKRAKFAKKFLVDQEFRKSYLKYLDKFSDIKYLDKFFDSISEEFEFNKKLLYKNNPALIQKKEVYYRNQSFIKSELNQYNYIRANLQSKNNNRISIYLENKSIGDIIPISLKVNKIIKFLPEKEYIVKSKIGSKDKENIVSFITESNFEDTNNSVIDEITFNYSFVGIDRIESIKVFNYGKLINQEKKILNFRIKKNLEEYPFIFINKQNKVITLKKGKWEIDEPIFFPSNYLIEANPGFNLKINNGAYIVSNSAIRFIGKSNNPIVIYSEDKSGGLAILKTRTYSRLSNVIFNGLSNASSENWEITGAVIFYESPVEIQNTIFKNNISEDSLNIIRSQFSITDSKFLNTSSDSLDLDFSDGLIENTDFINSGNDAIDISGSNVQVNDVEIIKVGDKAISAGEKSLLKGDNILIKNSEIAYASKDLSSIQVTNSFIDDTRLGFVSFVKKPQYGPASIEVSKSSFNNLEKIYLLEPNSSIKLNGDVLNINIDKVEKVLYGKGYGKSSK